jgi:hypothetical protein
MRVYKMIVLPNRLLIQGMYGKDAMKADDTVNLAALPASFNLRI